MSARMDKSKNQKDLDTLRKMIEWFDGYAACYNADPFRIDRLVRKKKDQEFVSAWDEISQDVSNIITLPDSSEEITQTQKRVRIYRPISAVLIFFSGLILLIVVGLHVQMNRVTLLVILVSVLALYAFVVSLWYQGSRKLYSMVREYYNKNTNKVSKQRAHIMAVVQRLIDSLTLSIRNDNLDPENYKMKLLHNSYTNIRVLREESSKNMGTLIYVSIVKARSPSQK